jgi:PIN domain nuclease of toxin-antitoxin system
MRLLLDTQIYLWWLADSRKLKPAARERIEAADEVFVSAASIVECEQKIAKGLLEVDPQELVRGIVASGFTELAVRAGPAASAAELKPIDGTDFFDRLLLAQAMSEPLRFLTANPALRGYTELVDVV